MKSLRILAHFVMVLLLTLSAAPATASGSADESMKPKSSGGDKSNSKDNKAGSKKEKGPKRDKYDKAMDDLDEALEGDSKKEKESKKDKIDKLIDEVDEASKKSGGDKEDSKKGKGKKVDASENNSEDDNDGDISPSEGTYRGRKTYKTQLGGIAEFAGPDITRNLYMELKLEKDKRTAYWVVKGDLKITSDTREGDNEKIAKYDINGAFYPGKGNLRATAKNDKGRKVNVGGKYKDGELKVKWKVFTGDTVEIELKKDSKD